MDSRIESLVQPAIALALIAISAFLLVKGVAEPDWLVGLVVLAITSIYHSQALNAIVRSGNSIDAAALVQSIVSELRAAPVVQPVVQPVIEPIVTPTDHSVSGAIH